MEKLSEEQVNQAASLTGGRNSRLRQELLLLRPGVGLRIMRGTDWQLKGSPFRIANYLSKRSQYKFKKITMADGSGWIIQRVG